MERTRLEVRSRGAAGAGGVWAGGCTSGCTGGCPAKPAMVSNNFIMSITSNELNYLVWRYLEESGHDLAAYALNKLSGCSEVPELKSMCNDIHPGCLVELVQKGILYGLVEKDSRNDAAFSLWGALAEKELARLKGTRIVETRENEDGQDIEMNGDANSAKEAVPKSEQKETKPVVKLEPKVSFSETITCLWHPLTEVLAYGQKTLTAVISAFNGDKIAESVELCHPILSDAKPEINVVSWSPQGTVIISAATNGELRAWLPDGKLKNIATVPGDGDRLYCTLAWNTSGQYFISIDMNNEVCLWDGNLTLLQQIQPPVSSDAATSSIEACWLDDFKFAVSSARRSIKIYSVLPAGSTAVTKPIGSLAGHENGATMLSFDPVSRFLASASDYDYLIKIWHSNSSHDALTLNSPESQVAHRHGSPLVCLSWIAPSVLMSVLMEGIVNIWDAKSGENKSSSCLFDVNNSRLVFHAQLSPSAKFLACGDNHGQIGIWEVSDDGLSQRGVYEAQVEKACVCDIKWNIHSRKLCVSYNNGPSVVLDWDEE